MWNTGTAYIANPKGLYYYKYYKKGCICNLSASAMHREFNNLLQQYQIAPKNIEPLKIKLQLTFEEMNKSLYEQQSEIDNRKNELALKIESAEERFIEGDIDRESFIKYKAKVEQQIAEIASETQKLFIPLSNQKKLIDFVLNLL